MVLTLSLLAVVLSSNILVKSETKTKMKFSPPILSSEEEFSQHLPDHLKCDACTAVAYKLTQALQKAETNRHGKQLMESDYLDLMENVCEEDNFNNYGLKQVEGENRLSGPGLHASKVPGILMGGGKWPYFLSVKCSEFLGEVGEDEIYSAYRRDTHLHVELFLNFTDDCRRTVRKIDEL